MVIAANHQSVYAIVLAAGAATRFGSSKQIAAWQDGTLVSHAINLAENVCQERHILVTGHDWCAVRAACQPQAGFFIVNEHYDHGMGASLAQAVRCVRHIASAVLVILADQPLISAEHLDALIAHWSGDDQQIVTSAYADTIGAPALFAAGCFDALAALDGDTGARSLFQDPTFDVVTVRFAAAASDIDTVADLTRIARNVRS